MIDKLGGRKMTITLLCLAIGVTVVLVKGDVSPSLVSLLLGAIGFFSAGNVAATKIEADKAAPVAEVTQAPAPTPEVDLTPIIQSQAQLMQNVQTLQQAAGVTIQKLAKFEAAYGLDKLPG
jgi:hypothetical protein